MPVTDTLPKRTPLYSEHEKRGAKIVPFGGWAMPVQYSSIIDEHNAVRQAVGVFDISHMGQALVSGARAKEWLNHVLTNNVDRLGDGEGQYTFLLNENGGVIDDLYVFRVAPEKFFSNIARYGNTSSASMLIAASEWNAQHGFERDRPVVFAAFGAGFHWGALLAVGS